VPIIGAIHFNLNFERSFGISKEVIWDASKENEFKGVEQMIFFTSWDSLIRILVIGLLSYLGLIMMLKFSGNRTLSQMNSFDFIITIAMGSTFSSGLLDKNVAFADTITALFLLIFMQYLITKATVKSKKFDKLIKADPVLLYHRGEFIQEAMNNERVSEDEILASLRENGLSTFSQVEAVVLETNGKLSTIPKQLSSEQLLKNEKSYKDAFFTLNGVFTALIQ